MANNTIAAYGLMPVTNSQLGPIKSTAYFVPASLAAIAIGTPVDLGGTSNTSAVINGQEYPAGTLPSIVVATGGDGNKLLGSIIGFQQVPQNIMPANGSYNPANTATVAWVADDVNQEFTAIVNGTIAVTDIGSNANLTIGSVNTFTGLDSTAVNATTAVTATFQLHLLRLNNAPNNVITQANPEVVVKINNHRLANAVLGV